VADDKDKKARQKAYYTKQRLDAEERADEGDSRARDTVSKIYGKLGRKPRSYTDTDVVDKIGLANVAGPDALVADAGIGLGKFALGKIAGKLGSKVAEGASEFAGKVTGKSDVAAKAENKMTSTGRKVVGKAADGQVKRGSPKPKLASAKSVEKTGTKAPDRVNKPIRKEEPKPKAEKRTKPRGSGGAKKTAAKAAKRVVTKETGSEAKSEVAEKVKPKAPVRNAKGKNPSKASRGKLSEAQKGTASKKAPEPTKPAGKPAPKAAPKPKSKADEAADEAAKKAITKKAMDAKARLKANLAKKGKLKKS
jgi:hypothetical protein